MASLSPGHETLVVGRNMSSRGPLRGDEVKGKGLLLLMGTVPFALFTVFRHLLSYKLLNLTCVLNWVIGRLFCSINNGLPTCYSFIANSILRAIPKKSIQNDLSCSCCCATNCQCRSANNCYSYNCRKLLKCSVVRRHIQRMPVV